MRFSRFIPAAFLLVIFTTFVGVLAITADHQRRHQPAYCDQPDVIVENMVPELAEAAPLWQMEVSRRFHHALVILVHGGDFLEGEWIVGSEQYGHPVITAKQIVRHFQQQFPDRTIVLVACNTGHIRLGVPGVYYAHSSVWVVPDRDVFRALGEANLMLDGREQDRSLLEPEIVGNIFEFTTDKE